MRILVVSDTHGNENRLLQAHELAGAVDTILHLGDGEGDTCLLEQIDGCPIIKVAGNCDIGSSAPRELLLELHNKRIMVCHGDRYGVKNGLLQLVKQATELQADAVLYGHTHQAIQLQQGKLLIVNPGTLWGRAPFLSYAILEINDHQFTAEIYKLP